MSGCLHVTHRRLKAPGYHRAHPKSDRECVGVPEPDKCVHASVLVHQGESFALCACGTFLLHSPCCFGGWATMVDHHVTQCCDCAKRHLHVKLGTTGASAHARARLGEA